MIHCKKACFGLYGLLNAFVPDVRDNADVQSDDEDGLFPREARGGLQLTFSAGLGHCKIPQTEECAYFNVRLLLVLPR